MRIAHLLLAFLLMPFTACSLSKIPVDTVVLPSSVQQTQLERATASGLLADVQDKMLVEPLATTKKDKFEGTVVVKGELHGTKGNQAMINGIILDPDYFLNSYNNEWKPEIEVLRGKIVKVMVEDAQPVEYDQVLFLVDPS